MKRLLTLLSLLSLMVLTACTIGQPGEATTSAPVASESPGIAESVSPSPSESGDPSGDPDDVGESASPEPGETASETPSAVPSIIASGSPSPAPTATGSAGDFRAPGEVLDLGGEVSVTVLDSKRAKVAGHRGNQVLVMAKTCNVAAASGIELSWDTWVLLGPDSEEYPASATHGSAEPAPVYPNSSGRLYKPGQCAKGWIVFDVPTGAKLSGVRYMNSAGDSAQWRLNASI